MAGVESTTMERPDGYAKLLSIGLDGLNINYPADGVQAVRAFAADAG